MAPEVRALHEELLGLDISERPSFAPELLAELERTWLDEGRAIRRRGPAWPRWAAAVAAGLVLMVASVPDARAAFVRLVTTGSLQTQVVEDRLPSEPVSPGEPLVGVLAEDAAPEFSAPVEGFAGVVPALDLPAEIAKFEPARVAYAEIRDRAAAEALVQAFYPRDLQEDGVRGTVKLQLWVDEEGTVSDPSVSASSGVPGLDQAAVAAAPFLRFYPALDRGQPVGTWVRFDLEFTGRPADERAGAALEDLDEPDLIELGGAPPDEQAPVWAPTYSVLPDPFPVSGEEMLLESLGATSDLDLGRLGSAADLLAGTPPTGTSPSDWRRDAAEALERGIRVQPENPAPYLALGRVRLQQGLRDSALRAFSGGIARVESSNRSVPPRIAADLHFERAVLLRAQWLAEANTGRIPVRALRGEACSEIPTLRGQGGMATGEELATVNFLCGETLDRVREKDFRASALAPGPELYLEDLEWALRLFPGHLEAGKLLALDLLDEADVESARDRVETLRVASGGHPQALLLLGVAAVESGQMAAAEDYFLAALDELDSSVAEGLLSPEVFMSTEEAAAYRSQSAGDRALTRGEFWGALDPDPSAESNERLLEHLSRSAYALLRFGDEAPDAAEIWVRMGRPQRRWAVADGDAYRTVFWDYGPGPDVVFLRSPSRLDLRLVPAARRHLDDGGYGVQDGGTPTASR